MKNKKNIIFAILILAGIFLITIPFWNNGDKLTVSDPLAEGIHQVEVQSVTQTTKYTYLLVEEGKSEYWIAISRQDITEGVTLYFSNALEMKNFASKELGKTFDKVYFVQQVSESPDMLGKPQPGSMTDNPMPQGSTPPRKQPETRRTDIQVEKVKGGVSIAELYEFHPRYAGKSIKVKGQVTHFSSQIMGKNWVHIQDGSEFAGNFDLALSTQDSVTIGSTVVFSGIVRLNKDFGSGYFYKILIEDAIVVK